MLVSYKQVKAPQFSEIETIELPSNKYQRMISYIDTKTDNKTKSEDVPTTVDETSDGFIGWVFNNTSTDSSFTVNTSDTWSSPYNTRKSQWISDMTASYKRAGLNDNAIKNLIAKNALESGWGKSAQGDYNFGNITTGSSWTGRFVQGKDHDANGKKISQKFRAYDSMDDYVKDEIQFLTKLYDFDQNDDLSTFLNKLQGGNKGKRKYAEDPSYKNKVKQIFNKYLIG